MIEMTFTFEDEIKAFEMLTYARSIGLKVSSVKKDGKTTPVHDGGFLKEKPVARRVPIIKEKPQKKVTNKHVIK